MLKFHLSLISFDWADFNLISLISIFLGFVWGLCNFYLLSQCLKKMILNFAQNFLSLLGLMLLKFPLLYYLGYKLLAAELFPPLYLLIGFSFALFLHSIFLVVNLKNFTIEPINKSSPIQEAE